MPLTVRHLRQCTPLDGHAPPAARSNRRLFVMGLRDLLVALARSVLDRVLRISPRRLGVGGLAETTMLRAAGTRRDKLRRVPLEAYTLFWVRTTPRRSRGKRTPFKRGRSSEQTPLPNEATSLRPPEDRTLAASCTLRPMLVSETRLWVVVAASLVPAPRHCPTQSLTLEGGRRRGGAPRKT